MASNLVIPAEAGTQKYLAQSHKGTNDAAPFFVASWLCAKQIKTPAFAGVTCGGMR